MHTDTQIQRFAQATVGELVAGDYRRADVFKKHGIDFCCGGKRTLQEVCAEKGIALETLLAELEQVTETTPATRVQHAAEWEPDFLADYIVNVHHTYVRESIPLLREFTAKVARVHGDAHPEVVEIARCFEELAQEMEQHMMKEEQVLFPYIKQMVVAEKQGRPLPLPPFGTVQNPIRMMEMEHDRAGELMKQIRQLSRDFSPPEDACNTYRVTYHKLQEFEADLHQHVHLENNILFPRAIELEEKLQG